MRIVRQLSLSLVDVALRAARAMGMSSSYALMKVSHCISLRVGTYSRGDAGGAAGAAGSGVADTVLLYKNIRIRCHLPHPLPYAAASAVEAGAPGCSPLPVTTVRAAAGPVMTSKRTIAWRGAAVVSDTENAAPPHESVTLTLYPL